MDIVRGDVTSIGSMMISLQLRIAMVKVKGRVEFISLEIGCSKVLR